MTFRVKLRVKRWKLAAVFADRAREYRELVDKARRFSDYPKSNECVTPHDGCKICGLKFTDAMGRPIAMGYVCVNMRCPSGMSFSATQNGPMRGEFWQ